MGLSKRRKIIDEKVDAMQAYSLDDAIEMLRSLPKLKFSETVDISINLGIDIVDGTVAGMGRGAGNMPLETLMAYCQKSINEEKYNVLPILDLIDRYFLSLMICIITQYFSLISQIFFARPGFEFLSKQYP